MNSKILAAFLGGALGASALVYVAMRPSTPRAQSLVSAGNEPTAKPVKPPPASEPVAAGAVKPPITVEEHTPPPEPTPARAKATPQARPHRDKPVLEARNTPSPPDPGEVPPSVRVDPPMPQAPAPQESTSVPQEDNAPPPQTQPAPAPEPNKVTMQRGMVITVRLAEALSTEKNQNGDTFFATLDQPLTVDGFVIAERGARVEGRVVEATPGNRAGGTAHLVLVLTRVNTSDGQRVAISTATLQKSGNESSHGADAAKVGGGAVLGAVIGAIAGGGKGAAIGAAAGGAAGAGAAVITHGHGVVLPVEARMTFRVEAPVTITERTR